MGARINNIPVYVLSTFAYLVAVCAEEPILYMSLERINVTYCNPDYGFLNATSARPGRWDHKYYVHVHMHTLKTLDNNLKVDLWFYEFRSNEYRRGFVEMHFRFCDFVMNDPIFGSALGAHMPDCPLLPGKYNLPNMSIPELPFLRTFPFRKGRIYGLWSVADVHVLEAYGDIEIKEKPRILYMSLERINVTYCNPDYGFLNATSARPGRWDHKYYVHVHMHTLKTLDNNLKVDLWFYEFRSNEYRRGFVEMHFRFCDFVMNDPIFGSALGAHMPDCPLLPGKYNLPNMSIPELPFLRTFPFRKGRIYGLWSVADVHVLEAYGDIEIKEKPRVRARPIKSDKNKTVNPKQM